MSSPVAAAAAAWPAKSAVDKFMSFTTNQNGIHFHIIAPKLSFIHPFGR